MTTEQAILENLIELTQDSVNGYREAAELVRESDVDLAELFEGRTFKRNQILEKLRGYLINIDPSNKRLSTDGTATGHLHQAFMQFRSLFQEDRKAALAEVSRGEAGLVKTYEDNLKDASPELRTLLQDCLKSIRIDEQSVEDLRESA